MAPATQTPQRRAVTRAEASPAGAPPSRLTLYTNRLCPYAQRVAFALAAKGVAHDAVGIDLRNKPAWYTSLVPGGKVPALHLPDEEAPRVESLALLRLIEDAFPGPRLVPEGGAAQTEALFALCDDVWVRRGYAVLSDAVASPAQLAAAFADVAAPVEAALAASGGPFLLGSALSLADAVFAPFTERYALAFRELRGWDLLAARPALAAWHAAVEALPDVRARFRRKHVSQQSIADINSGACNHLPCRCQPSGFLGQAPPAPQFSASSFAHSPHTRA